MYNFKNNLYLLSSSLIFSIVWHEHISHLPAKILKSLSVLISYVFEIIFNKCIENVICPNLLKCAWVTPIYKSGEKSEVSNYWPISSLLSFNKIFEKIIYGRLIDFGNTYSLISCKKNLDLRLILYTTCHIFI